MLVWSLVNNDILAAINITSARDSAAAAPALLGKALKSAITIEYFGTAGADINLSGSMVVTVLPLATRGQHRTRKEYGPARTSIASKGEVLRVCCDRKARSNKHRG